MYKSLQKGRELNFKTFLSWLWKSIYQVLFFFAYIISKINLKGGLIMILSVTLFDKSFINVVTITFTTLIFAEILNVISEVRT